MRQLTAAINSKRAQRMKKLEQEFRKDLYNCLTWDIERQFADGLDDDEDVYAQPAMNLRLAKLLCQQPPDLSFDVTEAIVALNGKRQTAKRRICNAPQKNSDNIALIKEEFPAPDPFPLSWPNSHGQITVSDMHWRRNFVYLGDSFLLLPTSSDSQIHFRYMTYKCDKAVDSDQIYASSQRWLTE
ncbi:uncharacterized protein TrAtP1_002486 [Trichoderma atroviride]|uniref:uncharacterized protein n=1 Tax=Hypocrea atroviridis TaxID=63577 RepID=UPI00331791D6|nr:hypothetical protein TrAtP1_002486 [Trichoderma atroviride]